MTIVKAFRGLRPRNEIAGEVASPPYDVLSSDEARVLSRDNPRSFLRVTKPEISFPADHVPEGTELYLRARQNLEKLIAENVMRQDEREAIYIYRLTWRGHSQTGFMLLSAVDDYLHGRIKRHEYTRPDKEADRTRLGEVLNAMAGPVFLFYPENPRLDSLLEEDTMAPPEADFSVDDVLHQLWAIFDPFRINDIVEGFARIENTYIADGHHRCAAAANLCKNRRAANHSYLGTESFNFFLSVIFPAHQLRILPYNRVVTDLNGDNSAQFLERVRERFAVEPQEGDAAFESEETHRIGMYLDHRWYRLRPLPDTFNRFDPIENLDPSILSKNLLDPVLGITKPRTDKRIDFVGGVRGTAELVRLVDSGEFKVAFSMPAVTLDALRRVADAGGVMPPKSTWFEPKLRSGLVVYLY